MMCPRTRSGSGRSTLDTSYDPSQDPTYAEAKTLTGGSVQGDQAGTRDLADAPSYSGRGSAHRDWLSTEAEERFKASGATAARTPSSRCPLDCGLVARSHKVEKPSSSPEQTRNLDVPGRLATSSPCASVNHDGSRGA